MGGCVKTKIINHIYFFSKNHATIIGKGKKKKQVKEDYP